MADSLFEVVADHAAAALKADFLQSMNTGFTPGAVGNAVTAVLHSPLDFHVEAADAAPNSIDHIVQALDAATDAALHGAQLVEAEPLLSDPADVHQDSGDGYAATAYAPLHDDDAAAHGDDGAHALDAGYEA